MRRAERRRALVLAVAIVAAGCAGTDEAGGPERRPDGVTGRSWVAEVVDGAAVPEGVRSTVSFPAPGRIAGSGGCNRYTGTVEIGRGTIRTGPLAATRMACPPPRMEQESRFLLALEAAARWRLVAGGDLELLDADGTVRLTLFPAPPPA